MGWLKGTVATLVMGLVSTSVMALGATSAQADGPSKIVDKFRDYGTSQVTDGDSFGPWAVKFAGYGPTRTEVADGGRLVLEPMAATAPDRTHASLVTSKEQFTGSCVRVATKMRTVTQLREGSAANPWEVGWLVWDYRDNQHFSYAIVKPNGFEVGQRHPDYTGGQRFLYTSAEPAAEVGEWIRMNVKRKERSNGSTRTVYRVNGERVGAHVDNLHPYTSGSIGAYSEDAEVDVSRLVGKDCS
ncbi:MAG: hypothetical protein K0U64_01725 [Actinomycetia bacterium]|nr:hypothetical protein [Actinomycetes bacterium]